MNVLLIERVDDLPVPAAQVPLRLVKHLIPFARTYFSSDDNGDLLELNIKTGPFSFWMHYIYMKKLTTLNPFAPSHVLALHHWFGGNIPAKLRDGHPVILGDNECNLFNILPEVHTAWPAIDSSLSIHLNLDPLELRNLAVNHPAFDQLAALPLLQNSGMINTAPYKIDEVRRETLNRIISCRYIHQQAEHFFQRNFLDMYLQFLSQLKTEASPKLDLDEKTRVRLSLLRMYIGSHPDYDITLSGLSAKSQLSPEVVSRGFVQLFNISLEDYILQVRMYKAFDLMMQTDMGKMEVARKVGYHSYLGFIRAFINFFGCDPVTLRREQ